MLFDKIVKLEKDAEAFGFKWETKDQILAQIQSEYHEIVEQLQNAEINTLKLEEEIGDLLHAVFSLTVFCQLSPKITLEKTLTKFEKRLNAVKQLAKENGLTTLENHTFDELMLYWNKAKELVG